MLNALSSNYAQTYADIIDSNLPGTSGKFETYPSTCGHLTGATNKPQKKQPYKLSTHGLLFM